MSRLKAFKPPEDYGLRWVPGRDPQSMPGGFNENAFDVSKQSYNDFDHITYRTKSQSFSGADEATSTGLQTAKAGIGTATPWMIGLLVLGALWTMRKR